MKRRSVLRIAAALFVVFVVCETATASVVCSGCNQYRPGEDWDFVSKECNWVGCTPPLSDKTLERRRIYDLCTDGVDYYWYECYWDYRISCDFYSSCH